MNEKRREVLWLPIYMILPLLLAFGWNNLVYFGSRLLTSDWHHVNAEIFVDDFIPFLPWTAIFYLSCYVFWIVNYCIAIRQERMEALRFLAADFFAKTICLFFFLLIPTTNTRPLIEGSGFWDKIMMGVYAADANDNLFPSIHCLTSWFCYIAVRDNQKIHGFYRFFSLIYALAVCVSTVTTKQHVFLDILGGVALAEGSYQLMKRWGFWKVYEKVIMGLNRKIGLADGS